MKSILWGIERFFGAFVLMCVFMGSVAAWLAMSVVLIYYAATDPHWFVYTSLGVWFVASGIVIGKLLGRWNDI